MVREIEVIEAHGNWSKFCGIPIPIPISYVG